MNHSLKSILPVVLMISVLACKDKSKPMYTPPDYSENYKYFPIKDGREWNYEITYVDSINNSRELYTELAKYNKDSSRTDYFRDGNLVSYAYWTNYDNKLGCCEGAVLVDYNQLECKSDSVLIFKKVSGTTQIAVFQYCEKKFLTDVPKYEGISCIKTFQRNTYKGGNTLLIINYFGYGVGLIFRQQTRFDKFGKFESQETQKLLSHNF